MATAPLKLTSLWRVRKYLKRTDANTTDDFAIMNLIPSVSRKIEQYLRRKTAKASYTQYYDAREGQLFFNPYAYPVSSLVSFYTDGSGLYSGDESEIDVDEIVNEQIGPRSFHVVEAARVFASNRTRYASSPLAVSMESQTIFTKNRPRPTTGTRL